MARRLKIIVEEKAAAPAKGWTRYAHQFLRKGRTMLYLWRKGPSFQWATPTGQFRGARFLSAQTAFAWGQEAGYGVGRR